MKNQPFYKRFQFAWAGIKNTFRTESSFQQQCLAALGAYALLFITKAPIIWWTVFTLVIILVLTLELVNTAIETLVDLIHPQQHDSIKKTKDCLAGAVLVASYGAIVLCGFYLYTLF